MNIGTSNWHNWSFDNTEMNFFNLIQFLTQLLTSKHLKPISNTSWREMEGCEKRAFQLLKMRKKSAET